MALLAVAAIGGPSACASDGSLPSSEPVGPPCTDGDTQECTQTLGAGDGRLSCYRGHQSCEDQRWSACTGGSNFQLKDWRARGEGSLSQLLSLSDAGPCENNPCNPFCQQFSETPDGGLIPNTSSDASIIFNPGSDAGYAQHDGGGVAFTWGGGSFIGMPETALSSGLTEPCQRAGDCQINTHCIDVSTGDACGHHKCEPGAPLDFGCDDCVDDICAVNSSCCDQVAVTCAHDPCVSGEGLDGTCNSCVKAVCDADSNCCDTGDSNAWDASCVALVELECAAIAEPAYCGCASSQTYNAITSSCYELFPDNSGWTTAQGSCQAVGTGWDLVAIADDAENTFVSALTLGDNTWIGANDRSGTANEGKWVWPDGTQFWSGDENGSEITYANWDTVGSYKQPNDYSGQDCGELKGDGKWWDEDCGDSSDYLCEGPPTTMVGGGVVAGGLWDQDCIDAVETVCGAICGSGDPPPNDGVCVPWLPSETDSSCLTFDVTAGLACDMGTTPNITVCNHGTDFAPPGLKIAHWAPAVLSGGQFGASTVDTSGATICTTTSEIPAGWCINTPCPGIVEGSEVVVNPADGTEDTGECRFDDNWGYYYSTACGPPICAGNASRLTERPVNMFFVVDKSFSMSYDIPTRWASVSTAMKAFFSDPDSAGLNVAMRFFPDDVPAVGCNETACDSEACKVPGVTRGALERERAPTDTQEQALFDALAGARLPMAYTPMLPALEGGLQWSRDRQADYPREVYVVVLVTDGEPYGDCVNDVSAIAAAAGLAYDENEIRTYVVGIEGVSEATIGQIATAGGGEAFFASAAQGNVTTQVVAALQSIAEQAVSCSYDLANQGLFDPDEATVRYVPGEVPADIAPSCLGDETEYNNRCYRPDVVVDRWDKHHGNCHVQGAGWELAKSTSSAINDELEAMMISPLSDDAWIGLHDQTDGSWRWADGTLPADEGYENWSGSPGSYECGYINAGDGDWKRARDCLDDDGSIQAICEGPKTGSPGQCDPGDVLGPDGLCYYFADTTAATWDDARTACAAHGTGWDIPDITTDPTRGDILTNFMALHLTGSSWLGGKDDVTEDDWLWLDGTQFYEAGALVDGCEIDEVEDSGQCYYRNTDNLNWDDAQTACKARGDGTNWDLVKVDDATENALVGGLGTTEVWLGGEDTLSEGEWFWPDLTQFWTGGAPAVNCSVGTEYNGSCYYLISTTRNWNNQKTACEALGMDLVTITSATENTWILDNIRGGLDRIFIGASRSGTNSTWVSNGEIFWTGGSAGSLQAPYTYENFGSGTPDDGECAYMFSNSYWYDRACTNSYAAVCEAPVSGGGGGWATAPLNYAPFASTQPNNSGTDSNCLYQETDDEWNDAPCADTRDSVCEGPLSKVSSGGSSFGTAYENFDTGEPDSGSSSNCLRLRTDGEWDDYPCGFTSNVVCVGPVPSAPAADPVDPGGSFTQVADVTACTGDDQWYYDDPSNPATLTLCDATCDRVKSDRIARLAVEIECYPTAPPPPYGDAGAPTGPVDTSYTQIYTSQCDSVSSPNWSYLAYDASTPGDSAVVFRARTALTEAGLSSAVYQDITTASAATQEVCGMGGPTPCPINLLVALGGTPLAYYAVMELEIELIAGSSGESPSLNDWDISYECPPSQ